MTESEQRELYVVIDYKDPEGQDHARGSKVKVSTEDSLANELLYRGVLSLNPVRRQAGENSERVTGDKKK
jgi:hypothetical protein